MFLEETRHHVGAKRKADTSVIFAPTGNVLVRVGPQQVAEQTTVRDLFKHVSIHWKALRAGIATKERLESGDSS